MIQKSIFVGYILYCFLISIDSVLSSEVIFECRLLKRKVCAFRFIYFSDQRNITETTQPPSNQETFPIFFFFFDLSSGFQELRMRFVLVTNCMNCLCHMSYMRVAMTWLTRYVILPHLIMEIGNCVCPIQHTKSKRFVSVPISYPIDI